MLFYRSGRMRRWRARLMPAVIPVSNLALSQKHVAKYQSRPSCSPLKSQSTDFVQASMRRVPLPTLGLPWGSPGVVSSDTVYL